TSRPRALDGSSTRRRHQIWSRRSHAAAGVNMLPELGKKVVTVGSALDNDVRVVANGAAPNHARIVNEGGKLWFESLAPGASRDNQPLSLHSRAEFDFTSDFRIGEGV